MYPITSNCQCAPSYSNYGDISESRKRVQAMSILASSTISKDLTIYTDEGDKVTISYDRETQASYEDLKALTYQGTISVNGDQAVVDQSSAELMTEKFLFEDEQNLEISVDGDLSEEELKDIKKVIKRIDKLMTDLLYGGNISKTMKQAEKTGGIDTIAGVEADYQYETTFTIQQLAAAQNTTYSRYALPEAQPTDSDTTGSEDIRKVVDQMAKLVDESDLKPSKLIKQVRELFSGIIEELKEDRPGNRAGRHWADLIGSELMKRIKQMDDGEDEGYSSSIA
ncbi:hypothetical protein PITCH_A1020026 [uncultured Desulfobacterium sp.]|uniref:DUF5610 domain-containing protein n=1 Tax=uncultured Desulfobacterium sp. TaxID=201089 RepID=A0A445MQQ8_9BACT|nr:hypothetical protein PITCH_A1020026 [uncultured Desulfobacterium sp.]